MPEAVSRADYVLVRDLLREKAGHDLGEGKEYLVDSRLSVVAEGLKLDGAAAVVERLRKYRERSVESAVIEAMMTGETSFFRNPSVFQRLSTVVIPALITARRDVRRLRIWSAGCSTGQEAYSVAMLLNEDFPELVRDWDVSILATDLTESAVRFARLGLFNAVEVRRGLSSDRLHRFFEPSSNRWKVLPSISRVIRFERLNLIEPLPFHAEFDLVLLRNVLIYFSEAAKREVFRSVREAMREDGYLFLGDSETILGFSEEFTFPPGEMDYYRPRPDKAASA